MEEKRCKVCGELFDEDDILEDGNCSYCENRIKSVGKIVKKNSASVEMSEFEPVFYKDYHEWIEITEWQNGEGVDIHIENKNKETDVSLHIDELDAIASLLDRIGYLPRSYCPKDNCEE
jgi:DNA-directed RNA polymerase subunit RPC12/RpoP